MRIKNVRIHVKLTEDASLDYLNAKLTLTEALMYKKPTALLKTSNTSMVASLVHEKTNEAFPSYNSNKLGIFEGCGTVSKWTLELNGLTRENDEDNYPIEDVIIYLTYTAREGGANA